MRHSYRSDLPPQPQPYRTQVLDHLGLVAGMFEELGITEVIDRATKQDPEMRIVTAGHAVKAMVLNGLGFINQQLYLVVYLSPAANSAGPVGSRPRAINQTVLTSHIGFPRPGGGR
jgi:hypothetical protein